MALRRLELDDLKSSGLYSLSAPWGLILRRYAITQILNTRKASANTQTDGRDVHQDWALNLKVLSATIEALS